MSKHDFLSQVVDIPKVETKAVKEISKDKVIFIFTDGACPNNQSKNKSFVVGGWACIIKYGETTKEFAGGERGTTNNRMELMAVITALEKIDENYEGSIIISSDSKYVIEGFTSWMPKWKRNNWKTTQKTDVVNKDLWERLSKASANKVIEWNWVKGHAGQVENERCDELARNEAIKLLSTQSRKVKTFHT